MRKVLGILLDIDQVTGNIPFLVGSSDNAANDAPGMAEVDDKEPVMVLVDVSGDEMGARVSESPVTGDVDIPDATVSATAIANKLNPVKASPSFLVEADDDESSSNYNKVSEFDSFYENSTTFIVSLEQVAGAPHLCRDSEENKSQLVCSILKIWC